MGGGGGGGGGGGMERGTPLAQVQESTIRISRLGLGLGVRLRKLVGWEGGRESYSGTSL